MRLRPLVLASSILAASPAAGGELLLLDGFDGAELDPVPWLQPEGPGTFFGRTQIRAPSQPVEVAGGALRLALDLHNPTALVPGDSFLGSEIRTRERFHPEGGTLAFEARMRFVDEVGRPLPSGIVGALFAFETDGFVRDEIDVELLSRDLRAGLERCLTNVFEDDGFDLAGRKAFAPVDGPADAFHRYRIEWRADRIRWLVDGVAVREVGEGVPDEPMDVRLNVWVPDAGFAEAFDPTLQPVADARLNQTYHVEVDEVRIERLPEPSRGLSAGVAMLLPALLARTRGRSPVRPCRPRSAGARACGVLGR